MGSLCVEIGTVQLATEIAKDARVLRNSLQELGERLTPNKGQHTHFFPPSHSIISCFYQSLLLHEAF